MALALVGILIALQFFPSGDQELTTATETLAISVVAFYFGLHMTTNGRTAGNDRGQGPPRRRRNPPDLAEPF